LGWFFFLFGSPGDALDGCKGAGKACAKIERSTQSFEERYKEGYEAEQPKHQTKDE